MKILLTGITGNLGFEIAHSLKKRKAEIVPVIRNNSSLENLNLPIGNAIEADLTERSVKMNVDDIDCIVHSAGNVHFEKSGESNSQMMRSIIATALELDVPIYYISTAFLWRKPGSEELLRNSYELDKFNAEKILRESGVPHTVFYPSVLTGHSESGRIINWTGYYQLASFFLEAARVSNGANVRFPILNGASNMVPVDQAAEAISNVVMSGTHGEYLFVTNPKPPLAQWVLETTLGFFDQRQKFEFIVSDSIEYETMDRNAGEELLFTVSTYFREYWALSYSFPESIVKDNLITKEYLERTLGVYESAQKIQLV